MVKNTKEYMKKYYTNNKNKFNKKILCEVCNKEISQPSFKKHLESKKHLDNNQEKQTLTLELSASQLRKLNKILF